MNKYYKYFHGAKDKKNYLLCIMLPKINWSARNFDKIKCIPFLAKDNELTKNIKKSGIKSTKLINKEYDNDPVYN